MATLHVRGEIDLATRDSFEQALERAMHTESDLTINLSELVFIDGAGLRALARTADLRRRQGQPVRLEQPSRHLRRLLTLVGVDYVKA
ncbi:STAS domain-containing protein [Actinoplanes sp. Pm04-4]|uniref:STAS domain-containing protein n=1 Tax=Paractinoplanes pyxinae TaxID=2997416 RepID=A0ABT4AY20_9ACTN|nr:STAS domain-containing protein [Actinoplanes pyxinae]MCY1139142.1 STAS domain-containing protein [Actinoplanes pyxinae]